MSRWRTSSCQRPDVSADGETPRCRSCESEPDLQLLMAQKTELNTSIARPSDESIGKMNLHWPACVPYRGLGEDASNGSKADAT